MIELLLNWDVQRGAPNGMYSNPEKKYFYIYIVQTLNCALLMANNY